jgi:hydrogenase-4 component B
MSPLPVALAGATTFLLSGLAAAAFPARVTAALSVLAGTALTAAGLWSLAGAQASELVVPWSVPGGSFRVALDAVSAVFLVPMGIVGALGAVYATRYRADSAHPLDHRLIRGAYGVLLASMAMVVLARNGVVFLGAWEVMAVSAFLLVAADHDRPDVREAGYIYLAATHASGLLLWLMFARIEAATGTFGFAPLPAGGANTLTLLIALAAFGLKAGFMPLHVWLPGAHASAPTHVSALLSGVLLKVGIYGIVRSATMVADSPLAFGGVIVLLGAISAVAGVAFALGQHDLKRLLAYHSIENIGIILLGIGLALMGRSLDRPEWIVLGLSGALLHVWNHAFFKALLFLSAGAVIHSTATSNIDRLGGLARAMPLSAGLFLVGAVAISGLPPLNGFVSELMIYLGLFRAAAPGGSMFASFAAPLLAFAGALTLACFVKVFGAVFLGTPRTPEAQLGREPPYAMLWPMVALAGFCVTIGLAPSLVAPGFDRAVAAFAPAGSALPSVASLAPLGWVSGVGLALVGLTAMVLLTRIHAWRASPRTVTWDCGYAAGSPRVQYTASSFADTLVDIFSPVLRPRVRMPGAMDPFPLPEKFSVHVDDVVLQGAVRPAFRRVAGILTRVRVVQSGLVNLYIFYILLGILALLLITVPVFTALERLWTG